MNRCVVVELRSQLASAKASISRTFTSRTLPRDQLGFPADGGGRSFSMRILGPRKVHIAALETSIPDFRSLASTSALTLGFHVPSGIFDGFFWLPRISRPGISRWLSQHGISRKRRNSLTRVSGSPPDLVPFSALHWGFAPTSTAGAVSPSDSLVRVIRESPEVGRGAHQ